jgi:taurine--2-oxoglutarate transaminase
MAEAAGPSGESQAIQAETREHVFVPWAVQGEVRPKAVVRAEGCWFYDAEGKGYLDFSSQHIVSNIGHSHPKVVAAIQKQAERLCYISPGYANDARSRLAHQIAQVAPGDLRKTLFTSGGSEANENAIKFARWYTGREKIITRYRSYHGATHGSMTLGGDNRRWASEPGIPGICRVFDPYCYRCPFGQRPETCGLECVTSIEEVIRAEGPDYVAAVFIEGITGIGGVLVPPPPYLPALRAVCDRYGILLVSDEVMTGFGRTGRWFAVDHWGVVPDMITFAKGVNGGYVPLGGVVISDRIASHFETHMYWGGLTYSGHPLACAAGAATLEVYHEEGLVERSAGLGRRLLEELRALQARHPSVGDVRGLGLFCGIELVKDPATREPLLAWQDPRFGVMGGGGVMGRMREAAMARGLYFFGKWNMIYAAPPLTITQEELLRGVQVLDEVLVLADEAAKG